MFIFKDEDIVHFLFTGVGVFVFCIFILFLTCLAMETIEDKVRTETKSDQKIKEK